jgi:hypothetical protein
MIVKRSVRGVGSEAGVCGDAAPVNLACAFAVLDAGEKQDDLFVLCDRRHSQFGTGDLGERTKKVCCDGWRRRRKEGKRRD